jgi:hypothetical protein
MATGNSVSVVFELDGTAGGSLVDFTSQIDKIGDFDIKNGMVTNTPLGTGAVTKAFTGMVEAGAFAVEGEITDGAAGTGIYKTLKAARGGVSRSYKLTFMTGEYVSGELLVEHVARSAGVGNINRFKSTLHPTGTITES